MVIISYYLERPHQNQLRKIMIQISPTGNPTGLTMQLLDQGDYKVLEMRLIL